MVPPMVLAVPWSMSSRPFPVRRPAPWPLCAQPDQVPLNQVRSPASRNIGVPPEKPPAKLPATTLPASDRRAADRVPDVWTTWIRSRCPEQGYRSRRCRCSRLNDVPRRVGVAVGADQHPIDWRCPRLHPAPGHGAANRVEPAVPSMYTPFVMLGIAAVPAALVPIRSPSMSFRGRAGPTQVDPAAGIARR